MVPSEQKVRSEYHSNAPSLSATIRFMAFLSQAELEKLGFASLGEGVLISDKTSIYGAERMHIGDRTRIDDFCVLSAGAGGFEMGKHVHIAWPYAVGELKAFALPAFPPAETSENA